MNDYDLPGETSEEYYAYKNNQINKGKKIVSVIVIVSVLQLVVGQFASISIGRFGVLDLLKIVVWGVIFFNLYLGSNWAKWLYIFSSLLTLIFTIGLLSGFRSLPSFSSWSILIGSVIDIVFSIILLASKDTNEFFNRVYMK